MPFSPELSERRAAASWTRTAARMRADVGSYNAAVNPRHLRGYVERYAVYRLRIFRYVISVAPWPARPGIWASWARWARPASSGSAAPP